MYISFFILGYFLPLYPLNNPKIQNFEKIKKFSGDIIVLHKCTKNHENVLHWSWDMMCDGCYFHFSSWAFFFLPFHPPSNPKNQNLKKKKKKKGQEHFLLFWPIFCPCAPLRTQIKIKKKNEKSTGRYHHFTHVYHKWQSYDVWFLRYGVQWTEFFVILDHFFPFTPITTQKIKTSTKWKKHLDISSFYTSVSKKNKNDHILHCCNAKLWKCSSEIY